MKEKHTYVCEHEPCLNVETRRARVFFGEQTNTRRLVEIFWPIKGSRIEARAVPFLWLKPVIFPVYLYRTCAKNLVKSH